LPADVLRISDCLLADIIASWLAVSSSLIVKATTTSFPVLLVMVQSLLWSAMPLVLFDEIVYMIGRN
jgi:hypothetical protein